MRKQNCGICAAYTNYRFCKYWNILNEESSMNKLFKGTAQDYLRLRARKHRNVYNCDEGAEILERLADGVDNMEREIERLDRVILKYKKQSWWRRILVFKSR